MDRQRAEEYLETIKAEKGIEKLRQCGWSHVLVMVSPMAPEGHGIVILSTERATNIQLLVDTPATWEPLGVARYIAVHVPYKLCHPKFVPLKGRPSLF